MNKDLGLLILRLSGLGLATAHGWGKFSALAAGGGERFIASVGNLGFPVPTLFAWAAALSEFVGGLCITLGLGTRVASSFAAMTMFVAAFVRHKAHAHLAVSLGLMQASEETLKAWGNPELALMYFGAFVAICLAGPGRFALDARIGRKG